MKRSTTMQATKLTSTFGRRRDPHTVIIARGDRVRHFTVGRSWLVLGSAVSLLLVAGAAALPARYVFAPSVEREAAEQQWRTRNEYEQRIATLRAELDRATSRQFLAQKMVESKVDVLLEQQEELAARYEKLQPLFERAKSTGLLTSAVPVPTSRPDDGGAEAPAEGAAADSLASADSLSPDEEDGSTPDAASSEPTIPAASGFAPADAAPTADWLGRLRAGAEPAEPADRPASADASPQRPARAGAVISDESLKRIGEAISTAELGQIRHLQALASSARGRTVRIASALAAAGIRVPDEAGEDRATGGPYEPVPAEDGFEATVAELDAALDALQRVDRVARDLPLDRPMPVAAISSTFGVRADPFLGRSAFHSGIDFAEPQGTDIHATAPGTVVKAGPFGGYGNMVEIDHGNGVTTRYGHMSKIFVSVGQKVGRTDAIGAVGSTGRSTGPHLHYEVRLDGRAIDPARFFRIGDRIRDIG
ncbi:M23 family metallopeptidase [Jiella sonneratiae]|uniref:M23 family metallopeptidase n=1 Tax=Jiella sonneratiae TaxID=2816856 RepID=A0ABS3J0F7_9HYPH|nr:M23 family metallopeptidase [Jiella sonneratiae]MBO0902066.1 M23 family metallopeptidase [Jiella sonneratiae]